MAETEEVTFEESSGNVFADLGLPNADELHARAKLAAAILLIVEDRKLTKAQAAKTLGITQRKFAAFHGFKLDDFSVGELMHFANALEYEVVIELRPRAQSHEKLLATDVHAA
jgi:predicted XRE-type DNA-binding protein